MKRLLLLSLLIGNLAFAADGNSALRDKAQELADALSNRDGDAIAGLMVPAFLDTVGGKELVIREYRKIRQDALKNGTTTKATVGEISEGFGTPPYRGAFVHYTQTMKFKPRGTFNTESFWLAISSDNGNSWGFFEGQPLTADTVKALIPGYAGTPAMPTHKEYRLPF